MCLGQLPFPSLLTNLCVCEGERQMCVMGFGNI